MLANFGGDIDASQQNRLSRRGLWKSVYAKPRVERKQCSVLASKRRGCGQQFMSAQKILQNGHIDA